MQEIIRSVEARPGDEATVTELDLRLDEWASAELKSVAAHFCHELILFCEGKALKIVLTNKEGEGFEAWRALVNKCEPTSKASVVGKLAEILRTPFDGDLLDAITTFERKIMIFEAQSREMISDSLKICFVIAGISRKLTKCGKHGHTAKECRSSSHGGAEKLNAQKVERNIMDSVGHGATHHTTKIHRTIKVESAKEEKAETMGKEKAEERKGQRLNEITEPPEEQWTGGSWEQWSEQSWNAEADTASRDDDWYTADSNSQTSAAAEEFQHVSVGDLRPSNLGLSNTSNLFNMNDWILHGELSHLVLIPLHAKLLFPPTTLQDVGTWSTKTPYLDVRTALQAETKCMIKERGSCAR